MKEADFRYFLNGVEVERDTIDWENVSSVTSKENDIFLTSDIKDEEFFVPQTGFDCSILSRLLTHLSLNDELFLDSKQDKITHTKDTGVKYNNYKAPLDIVQNRQFPKALHMLSLATAFGNKKYKETDEDFLNFKRVKGGSQTYFDAAARHNAVRFQEAKDTGLPHLVHAVWNMMAALEIALEENRIDVESFSADYLKNLHKS